ncbi:hypothetical protein [Pacificoceanicola onchidii]|uniref:hypothetical protein n=1 Tax=Pacificoceanicola onchidii TaxID=2562685 RepID=UPI0010A6180E|nr:hypothetical protein [Pacificoceanicola onchidii]
MDTSIGAGQVSHIVFSIVYTCGSVLIVLWAFIGQTEGPVELIRFLSFFFVAGGLYALWLSVRRYKRRQSLRTQKTEFGIEFVWIDFDGSERRSSTDPTPQWDATEWSTHIEGD